MFLKTHWGQIGFALPEGSKEQGEHHQENLI